MFKVRFFSTLFLSVFFFSPISFATPVPSNRNEVKEWSRNFDRGQHHTQFDRDQRERACRPARKSMAKTIIDRRLCKYFNRKNYFSHSSQFLALLNFEDPWNTKNQKNAGQQFDRATEAFDKFTERFFFDPGFACERPALNLYFSRIFDLPEKQCPKLTTEVASRNFWAQLDPSRVYEVHYFFAGKGKNRMSRWGHSMLRLVMCPDGVTPSDKCLEDLTNDWVLSFRANVEDLGISQWKGLFGGYPSQLFVLPFEDVRKEYNKLELREVTSIPLRLTSEQIRLLIYKTLETYWTYRGGYYFLGNNCATEILHLLQSVLDDRQFLHFRELTDPVTPNGVSKALRKSNLGDFTSEKNQSSARAKGYYFPSDREGLKISYNYLTAVDVALGQHFKNFESFLKSSPNERKQWASFYESSIPSDKRIVYWSAWLDLEISFAFQNEVKLRKSVFKVLKEATDDETKLLGEFRDLLMANYENQILNFDFGHDGVPTQEQFQLAREKVKPAIPAAEMRTMQATMEKFLVSKLPQLTTDIANVNANIAFFRKMVSSALSD